jgi:hypothetical protein
LKTPRKSFCNVHHRRRFWNHGLRTGSDDSRNPHRVPHFGRCDASRIVYDNRTTAVRGPHTFPIRNSEARKNAVAAGGLLDLSNPSRVFTCGNSGCALAAVKTVDGTRNYHATGKPSRRDKEAVALVEIPLSGAHGE